MKGDYEGLYTWLDEMNAKERGYNLALIKNISFDTNSEINGNDDNQFKNFIRNSIQEKTKIGGSDRIYMIWRGFTDNKLKGSFLFGHSKSVPPWNGYARTMRNDDIDLVE